MRNYYCTAQRYVKCFDSIWRWYSVTCDVDAREQRQEHRHWHEKNVHQTCLGLLPNHWDRPPQVLHLNAVRAWQQSSKGLPAGAMPSVVKVHTEEPPRVVREVERLSRNPENDWRMRAAAGGRMEFPRHPENQKRRVCQMIVDALTVKKKTIEIWCQTTSPRALPGDEVTDGRGSLQKLRKAAMSWKSLLKMGSDTYGRWALGDWWRWWLKQNHAYIDERHSSGFSSPSIQPALPNHPPVSFFLSILLLISCSIAEQYQSLHQCTTSLEWPAIWSPVIWCVYFTLMILL